MREGLHKVFEDAFERAGKVAVLIHEHNESVLRDQEQAATIRRLATQG